MNVCKISMKLLLTVRYSLFLIWSCHDLFNSQCQIFAYQNYDSIFTVIRTEHAGKRTPWTDVRLKEMPRYGESKLLNNFLIPLYDDDNFMPDFDIKMSMAFSERKHTIPWIQVFDTSTQQQLQKLEITFLYSGSSINHLKWETSYKKISSVENPQQIQLSYSWQKDAETHDMIAGMLLLFALSVISSFVLCGVVLTNDEKDATKGQ
mmetsp:Transcript_18757/g.24767  ORF Transcript_18757/g.24767 Transcript_18757/m.24767 type:complete len:206 (-) Transcript_18757:125-742(-)